MTTLFRKVVDAEGQETYEEIDPKTVEIPDDHPVNVKLKEVFAERKHKVERLRDQIKQLESSATSDDGKDETPAPTQPAKPEVPAFDPVAFKAQLKAEMKADEAVERQAAASRTTAIDSILKDTGLDATLRPVIEAISDLSAAKAQAAFLAQQSLRFDKTPSDGNGERDVTSLFTGVDKRLNLPKKK